MDMTNPQAAVIHKIDRAGINATIDGLTATLNQSPPMPTPPKVIGLTGILLAAVDGAACYGVALFDTADHAKAATNAFTAYWKTTANLGAAVHTTPVVASTVDPTARMVWAQPVPPIAPHVAGLLDGVQWALDSAFRLIRQRLSPLAQSDLQSGQDDGPAGRPDAQSDQNGRPVGQALPTLDQPGPAPAGNR
jgi:hypothetical protein